MDAFDESGRTALMYLTNQSDLDKIKMARRLLENEADPNAKTARRADGMTELAIRDAMRRAGLSRDDLQSIGLGYNFYFDSISPMLCAFVTQENSQEITEILITAGAEPLDREPDQEEIEDIVSICRGP